MKLVSFGNLLLLGGLAAMGCDKTVAVSSCWSDGTVFVDGRGEDWADVPLESFKEAELSIGVRNDEQRLYLLVVTWSEALIRELQVSGATMWVSSSGDRKKRDFGLHVRGGLTFASDPPAPDRAPEDEPMHGPPPGPPVGRGSRMALQCSAVDSKGTLLSLPIDRQRGLAVAANCEGAVCAYEIAIPRRWMAEDVRYALEPAPGSSIGIGLELSLPQKPRAQPARSEGPPGGGFGGRGGGMGGGMGGPGMGGGMGGSGMGGPGMGGGMDGMGEDVPGDGKVPGDESRHGKAKRSDRGRRHQDGQPGKEEMKKTELWLSVILATSP